ncbi:hypothetical protein PAXINDRAFT_98073 [Paxillus involutus ATCC 200175]|nr:hypothetical protein PAXINDRAFT_98073 [Paxillus involutus ATCC 200175]
MADLVAEYMHLVQLTRFCQMAPYVVMLYDHFLTFDQEIEHIWNKPWTLTSILYVTLRYPGSAFGWFSATAFLGSWSYNVRLTELKSGYVILLMGHLVVCVQHGLFDRIDADDVLRWLVMTSSCKIFIYVQGWPASVTVWLVQFILQMRLYALYNKSKKLVVFTGAMYLAEIIAMSGILLKVDLEVETSNQPLPGITICTALMTPNVLYSFWIPPLVFESILCFLSIWVGVKRSRQYLKPALVKGNRMRLVNVVIMGNVMYFFGILLSYAVNAAMWQALGPGWIEIPEGFPQAAAIIAGCPLILHVRDASSASSTRNTTKPSDSTQVVVQYPMQKLSRKHILDNSEV